MPSLKTLLNANRNINPAGNDRVLEQAKRNIEVGEFQRREDVTPQFQNLPEQGYLDQRLYRKIPLEVYMRQGLGAVHEIAAQRQTAPQQLFNGLLKATGKFLNYTVVGTLGTVYGLAKSLYTGKVADFFDNEVINKMVSIDEELARILPNLRTQREREMSLFRRVFTSNFLADEFLGGMSFLASAYVTGLGTSGLISKGLAAARSSFFNAISKAGVFSKAARTIGKASAITRAERLANTALTTMMSAGFESAFEANHAKKEIMDSLIEEHKKRYFKEPTKEDLVKINDIADTISSGVLLANYVTVGMSNILMFNDLLFKPVYSKVFGSRITRGFDRVTRFNKGVKIVEEGGKFVAKSRYSSSWFKAYKRAAHLGDIAREGIEEGLQGLYSGVALDYVTKKYSMDGADGTWSFIDAMQQQTADYLKNMDTDQMSEILVGAMMGAIGLPGTATFGKNVKGVVSPGMDETTRTAITRFNNSISREKMIKSIQALNRVIQLQSEKQDMDNLFDLKNKESEEFFNMLFARGVFGLEHTVVEDTNRLLDNITKEEFEEQFGYESLTDEEFEQRKKEIKEKAERAVEDFRWANNKAKLLTYSDDDEIREGFAFLFFGARDMDRRIDRLVSELVDKGLVQSKDDFKKFVMQGDYDRFFDLRIQDLQKKIDDLDNILKESNTATIAYNLSEEDIPSSIRQKYPDDVTRQKIETAKALRKAYQQQIELFNNVNTLVENIKLSKNALDEITKALEAVELQKGTGALTVDVYDFAGTITEFSNYLEELNNIRSAFESLSDEDKRILQEEDAALLDIFDRYIDNIEQTITFFKALHSVAMRMRGVMEKKRVKKNIEELQKIKKQVESILVSTIAIDKSDLDRMTSFADVFKAMQKALEVHQKTIEQDSNLELLLAFKYAVKNNKGKDVSGEDLLNDFIEARALVQSALLNKRRNFFNELNNLEKTKEYKAQKRDMDKDPLQYLEESIAAAYNLDSAEAKEFREKAADIVRIAHRRYVFNQEIALLMNKEYQKYYSRFKERIKSNIPRTMAFDMMFQDIRIRKFIGKLVEQYNNALDKKEQLEYDVALDKDVIIDLEKDFEDTISLIIKDIANVYKDETLKSVPVSIVKEYLDHNDLDDNDLYNDFVNKIRPFFSDKLAAESFASAIRGNHLGIVFKYNDIRQFKERIERNEAEINRLEKVIESLRKELEEKLLNKLDKSLNQAQRDVNSLDNLHEATVALIEDAFDQLDNILPQLEDDVRKQIEPLLRRIEESENEIRRLDEEIKQAKKKFERQIKYIDKAKDRNKQYLRALATADLIYQHEQVFEQYRNLFEAYTEDLDTHLANFEVLKKEALKLSERVKKLNDNLKKIQAALAEERGILEMSAAPDNLFIKSEYMQARNQIMADFMNLIREKVLGLDDITTGKEYFNNLFKNWYKIYYSNKAVSDDEKDQKEVVEADTLVEEEEKSEEGSKSSTPKPPKSPKPPKPPKPPESPEPIQTYNPIINNIGEFFRIYQMFPGVSEPKVDENGNPVVDDEGNVVYELTPEVKHAMQEYQSGNASLRLEIRRLDGTMEDWMTPSKYDDKVSILNAVVSTHNNSPYGVYVVVTPKSTNKPVTVGALLKPTRYLTRDSEGNLDVLDLTRYEIAKQVMLVDGKPISEEEHKKWLEKYLPLVEWWNHTIINTVAEQTAQNPDTDLIIIPKVVGETFEINGSTFKPVMYLTTMRKGSETYPVERNLERFGFQDKNINNGEKFLFAARREVGKTNYEYYAYMRDPDDPNGQYAWIKVNKKNPAFTKYIERYKKTLDSQMQHKIAQFRPSKYGGVLVNYDGADFIMSLSRKPFDRDHPENKAFMYIFDKGIEAISSEFINKIKKDDPETADALEHLKKSLESGKDSSDSRVSNFRKLVFNFVARKEPGGPIAERNNIYLNINKTKEGNGLYFDFAIYSSAFGTDEDGSPNKVYVRMYRSVTTKGNIVYDIVPYSPSLSEEENKKLQRNKISVSFEKPADVTGLINLIAETKSPNTKKSIIDAIKEQFGVAEMHIVPALRTEQNEFYTKMVEDTSATFKVNKVNSIQINIDNGKGITTEQPPGDKGDTGTSETDIKKLINKKLAEILGVIEMADDMDIPMYVEMLDISNETGVRLDPNTIDLLIGTKVYDPNVKYPFIEALGKTEAVKALYESFFGKKQSEEKTKPEQTEGEQGKKEDKKSKGGQGTEGQGAKEQGNEQGGKQGAKQIEETDDINKDDLFSAFFGGESGVEEQSGDVSSDDISGEIDDSFLGDTGTDSFTGGIDESIFDSDEFKKAAEAARKKGGSKTINLPDSSELSDDDFGDIPFSIRLSKSHVHDLSSFEEESRIVEKLLGKVPVRKAAVNIVNRNIINGYVQKGVIYLTTNPEKGTGAHESFHYITRTFLTDNELDRLYKEAARRYDKPSQEELDRLASLYDKEMDYDTLYNIWLEEKLADDFVTYYKTNELENEEEKSWLRRIFEYLKQLVNKIFRNQNAIDRLYKAIIEGKFVNTGQSRYNIGDYNNSNGLPFYSVATKTTIIYLNDNGKASVKNDYVVVSNVDLNMIASQVAYFKNHKDDIDPAIKKELKKIGAKVKSLSTEDYVTAILNTVYDINKYKDFFQNNNVPLGVRYYYMNRFNAVRNALSKTIEVIEVRNGKPVKVKRPNPHYGENIKRLKKRINEIEQAAYNPDRDYDPLVDADDGMLEAMQFDSVFREQGFKTIGRMARMYLYKVRAAYDFFEMDMYYNGNQEQKYVVPVEFLYNTLISITANTPQENILRKLIEYQEISPFVSHFIETWITDIANELGIDKDKVITFTHEQLSHSSIYSTMVSALDKANEEVIDVVFNIDTKQHKFFETRRTSTDYSIMVNNWRFASMRKANDFTREELESIAEDLGDIAEKFDIKVNREFKNGIVEVDKELKNRDIQDFNEVEKLIFEKLESVLYNSNDFKYKSIPEYLVSRMKDLGIYIPGKMAEYMYYKAIMDVIESNRSIRKSVPVLYKHLGTYFENKRSASQFNFSEHLIGIAHALADIAKRGLVGEEAVKTLYTDKEIGAITRLKEIAKFSMYFGDLIRNFVVLDAQYNKIYTIANKSLDNTLLTNIKSYAHELKEIIEDSSTEFDEYKFGVIKKIFGINDYLLAKQFFISNIKNNPIFKINSNGKLELEEAELYKLMSARAVNKAGFNINASPYSNMSVREKLALRLSLFASAFKVGNKAKSLIIPSVFSDNKTAKTIAVDYRSYYRHAMEKELTDEFYDHVKALINGHNKKVRLYYEVYKYASENAMFGYAEDEDVYDVPVIEGYNVARYDDTLFFVYNDEVYTIDDIQSKYVTRVTNKTRKEKFLEHWRTNKPSVFRMMDFRGLAIEEGDFLKFDKKTTDKFVLDLVKSNLRLYHDNMVIRISDLDKFNKAKTLAELHDIEYTTTLFGQSNRQVPIVRGLKKGHKGIYLVDPGVFINFVVTSTFVSAQWSRAITGDVSIFKDILTATKRAKGIIASGTPLGKTNVSVIKKEEAQAGVITYKNGRPSKEKAIFDKIAQINGNTRIDITDGQSYATVQWYYDVYLSGLGRITNRKKFEQIRKKLVAGVPLNNKEISFLKNNMALITNKKPVMRDLFSYMKTSVVTVSRELVSRYKLDEQVLQELEQASNEKEKRIILSKFKSRVQKKAMDIAQAIRDTELSEDADKEIKLKSLYSDLHELFEPIPGREKMHALLNEMELQQAHISVVESGEKMLAFDVGQYTKDDNGNYRFVINPSLKSFLTEQVVAEGIKDRIFQPVQLTGLAWTEQSSKKIKTLTGANGSPAKMGQEYRRILASKIQLNFDEFIRNKTHNGSIDREYLRKIVAAAVETFDNDKNHSGLVGLVDDKGNLLVDYNMPIVSKRIEEIVTKSVFNDVVRKKRAGSSFTLTSPDGFEVAVDENDNVIPVSEQKHGEKYITRPLKYGVKEDGIYYAEAIVPAWFAEQYGLKPGSEVQFPSEKLRKAVAVRIPTQEKSFMVTIKVVDVLPDHYTTAAIMPKEFILLSGTDFDFDALYVSTMEIFSVPRALNQSDKPVKKVYGWYTSMDELKEQVYANLLKNKELINKAKNKARKEVIELIDKYVESEEFIRFLFNKAYNNKDLYNDLSGKEREKKIKEYVLALLNSPTRQDLLRSLAKKHMQENDVPVPRATDLVKKYLLEEVDNWLDIRLGKHDDSSTNREIAKQNIEFYKKGEFWNVTPIFDAEANNLLVALEMHLIHNEHNAMNAFQAEGIDLFVDDEYGFQRFVSEFHGKEIIPDIDRQSFYDPASLAIMQDINDGGKQSVGIAASANTAFQKIDMTNDKESAHYINTVINGKPIRRNKIISSIISLEVDNAKYGLANVYNLTGDSLGAYLMMIYQGIDYRVAGMLIKHPLVDLFVKEMKNRKGVIAEKSIIKKLRNNSTTNTALFFAIRQYLENNGIDVWTDEEIAGLVNLITADENVFFAELKSKTITVEDGSGKEKRINIIDLLGEVNSLNDIINLFKDDPNKLLDIKNIIETAGSREDGIVMHGIIFGKIYFEFLKMNQDFLRFNSLHSASKGVKGDYVKIKAIQERYMEAKDADKSPFYNLVNQNEVSVAIETMLKLKKFVSKDLVRFSDNYFELHDIVASQLKGFLRTDDIAGVTNDLLSMLAIKEMAKDGFNVFPSVVIEQVQDNNTTISAVEYAIKQLKESEEYGGFEILDYINVEERKVDDNDKNSPVVYKITIPDISSISSTKYQKLVNELSILASAKKVPVEFIDNANTPSGYASYLANGLMKYAAVIEGNRYGPVAVSRLMPANMMMQLSKYYKAAADRIRNMSEDEMFIEVDELVSRYASDKSKRFKYITATSKARFFNERMTVGSPDGTIHINIWKARNVKADTKIYEIKNKLKRLGLVTDRGHKRFITLFGKDMLGNTSSNTYEYKAGVWHILSDEKSDSYNIDKLVVHTDKSTVSISGKAAAALRSKYGKKLGFSYKMKTKKSDKYKEVLARFTDKFRVDNPIVLDVLLFELGIPIESVEALLNNMGDNSKVEDIFRKLGIPSEHVNIAEGQQRIALEGAIPVDMFYVDINSNKYAWVGDKYGKFGGMFPLLPQKSMKAFHAYSKISKLTTSQLVKIIQSTVINPEKQGCR